MEIDKKYITIKSMWINIYPVRTDFYIYRINIYSDTLL